MAKYEETLAADKLNEAVVTPAAGKRIRLLGGFLKNATEGEGKIQLSAGAQQDFIVCAPGAAKAKGVVVNGDPDAPVRLTAKANSRVKIVFQEISM